MLTKLWRIVVVATTALLLVGCASDAVSPDPGEPAAPATQQADETLTATASGARLIATAPLFVGGCSASCQTTMDVFDDRGNQLRSIEFDNEITLVEVDYPGRTVALVHHTDGSIEPFAVDVETGQTQSIGFFPTGYAGMNLLGQSAPASKWHQTYAFGEQSVLYLTDLETLSVRAVTDIAPRTLVSFADDDSRAAIVRLNNTVEIVEVETFRTQTTINAGSDPLRAVFISSDGQALATVSQSSNDESGAVVRSVDLRTNELAEIDVGGFVLGWFDNDQIVVQGAGSTGDEVPVVLVDAKTGLAGASHQSLVVSEVRAVPDAPWHISQAVPSPQLVNVVTGAIALDASVDAMAGLGQPLPRTDYVWMTTFGVNSDGSSRFGVTRADLRRGELTAYAVDRLDVPRLSAGSFRYSSDGGALVAISSAGSVLLAADGTLEQVPAATGASFCDDGSYLLTGRSITSSLGEASPTELFQRTVSVADFGIVGQAICIG